MQLIAHQLEYVQKLEIQAHKKYLKEKETKTG